MSRIQLIVSVFHNSIAQRRTRNENFSNERQSFFSKIIVSSFLQLYDTTEHINRHIIFNFKGGTGFIMIRVSMIFTTGRTLQTLIFTSFIKIA